MRAWTGVGLAVALVVLVAAVVVAVVMALRGDGDGEEDTLTRADVIDTRTAELLDIIESGTQVTPEEAQTAVAASVEGLPTEVATPSRAEVAALDDSSSLPGTFVGSQGRGHFEGGLAGHAMTPFCNGVPHSVRSDPEIEIQTVGPVNRCHLTNPLSSGTHLGVQRNVDLGGGRIINIPPDPDVYPHDVEIPRDAIPHILEHAGVFVGYHCADGDAGCEEFVVEIEDLVNQRIDEFDDRVVMARDSDLPVGEIGLAAWTRVLNVRWDEVELDDIEEFISVHSCRFDPEGFCG